jgi:hypothetical protein
VARRSTWVFGGQGNEVAVRRLLVRNGLGILRGVLMLGLLAAPFAAEAQPVGKVLVVGYLVAAAPRPGDETFRQAMRELGYVEGRNIIGPGLALLAPVAERGRSADRATGPRR